MMKTCETCKWVRRCIDIWPNTEHKTMGVCGVCTVGFKLYGKVAEKGLLLVGLSEDYRCGEHQPREADDDQD